MCELRIGRVAGGIEVVVVCAWQGNERKAWLGKARLGKAWLSVEMGSVEGS